MKPLKSIIFIIFSLLIIILSISSTLNKAKSDSPVIYKIEPEIAFIGDEIIITGNNFGSKSNGYEVFFGDINCKEYDFDYISWNNTEIKIKVPTGAESGNLILKINDDIVKGGFITLLSDGSRKYSEEMALTINHNLSVNFSQEVNHPLYIWLPSAILSDTQREVRLINSSYNLFDYQQEVDLFKITYQQDINSYFINKKFTYKSYQIETNIESNIVSNYYNIESDFYKYYTASEYAVESDNPLMIKTANQIIGDEINPYKKAKLIYDWVVGHLEYQYPPPNRNWEALHSLKTGKGDCAVYSFLFTALCRAVGIPARHVAGHVLFRNNTVSMHFWAEFYIPKYGWIPIDANYGDTDGFGFMPKEFYFGNLDNRHIAFSKGRVQLKVSDMTDKEFTIRFLQKYYTYTPVKTQGNSYNIKRYIFRDL